MPRKLTAADVCELTGYSRSELRSLLNALPYYRSQESHARYARQYTRQDLIVICLVHTLEVEYGMRRDAVATIFDALRSALSGPKGQNRQARLVITLSPAAVRYEEGPAVVHTGICVPLEAIFERVDRHFGALFGMVPEQRDLALSPTLVAARREAKTS